MTNQPRVTGTFLQPDAFISFTADDWLKHFTYLNEAGIDTVIIQWIAVTPYGKPEEVFYPAASMKYERTHPDLLPRLLEAAKQKRMKVFVGLNISDEWWQIACSRDDWNRTQADICRAAAAEILSLYKRSYPDTLYGWYFAWEMFNGMFGREDLAADFLNMNIDALNGLSPDMPVLLSPFVRSVGGPPEQAEREWTAVFSRSHLRPGDIFCCQDAVGAEHITIDELDGYFAALRRAADTKEGLLFWANSECFRRDSPGVFETSPVDRFIRQMEIAAPYVSGFVTFAYSHYYSPDVTGRRDEHDAYVRYLNRP